MLHNLKYCKDTPMFIKLIKARVAKSKVWFSPVTDSMHHVLVDVPKEHFLRIIKIGRHF